MNFKYSYFFIFWLIIIGCTSEENIPETKDTEVKKSTYFDLLDANTTGIHFVNQVVDRNDINILTYRNYYNGGGVAIGDLNNDGLSDIYFTSNLGSNKLYLNKGDFKFEDITDKAGVSGTRSWSTGVTMADINADGYLDIYVSNSGDIDGGNKQNELFINNGDLTFSDQAEEYGLDNKGYSTQAAFFDYDQDGDLDCYLLNTSFKDPAKIELYKSMRDTPDELSGDKLYRNDGARFTDVTLQAGIYSSQIGFGLGTCIGDVNNDYLPDIYVSNDFWERDYLYINKGDGTFSEELHKRVNFCSISSMGGDIADINNDGYPEIISTDMLAADNYRLKAMTQFDAYHIEDMKYRANYHYQIGQNCLHLNDGTGKFQEVAMMSGVSATDWSWGALFFDFENDGLKDLFISNGLQKDLMSMDFRDFMSESGTYQKMANKEEVNFKQVISKMPSSPLKNYAFSNTGNLNFENKAADLGLDKLSFSNGSAYGDLDNDGDLDLVVNNVNMHAFVYKNEAEKTNNNYLKVKFKGPESNPFGIGARVVIKTSTGTQVLENLNTRGFQSSTAPEIIFGLGSESIKSLVVVWPDFKKQTLSNVASNEVITLNYGDASSIAVPDVSKNGIVLYQEVSNELISGRSRHIENEYNDFDHEILLLSKLSEEGHRILKSDVNSDGREDFLLLGAKDDEDKLFVQSENGKFERKKVTAFSKSKNFESSCGVFFDYDKDGDQDLLIGSGGNEYQLGRDNFVIRYFKNDGAVNFEMADANLPPIIANVASIESSDIDNDGDEDLFIGSRCVPGNYGIAPRSYLLQNEGSSWTDISSPELQGVGMVTDATWADTDGDGDEDLVIVGDWMAIHVFENTDGDFKILKTIPESNGWWNRIVPSDLDGDGDMDFVIGNRGDNSKLKASPGKPMRMFVNDFDQNGKTEFIINWYPPNENKAYPFATKPEITQQLPALKKQILKYDDYAKQTYESMFSDEVKKQSIAYELNNISTSVLWNNDGKLELTKLPKEAQISPVFGIVSEDLDGDYIKDIWLGGNMYGIKPQIGRHDASRGVFLKGSKSKTFGYQPPSKSGIYVEGEVRDAVSIKTKDGIALLIGRNNEDLLMFKKDQ